MSNETHPFDRPEAQLSTSRLIELLDAERERAENLLQLSTSIARELAEMTARYNAEHNALLMWQGMANNERVRADGAEAANRVLIERLHGLSPEAVA